MSAETFRIIGLSMALHRIEQSSEVGDRRFRSLFGVSPVGCGEIWIRISPMLPGSGQPKHLLWSLLFMKTYYTEHTLRVITGADEKTQRKWIWICIKLIAAMDIVSARSSYVYANILDF